MSTSSSDTPAKTRRISLWEWILPFSAVLVIGSVVLFAQSYRLRASDGVYSSSDVLLFVQGVNAAADLRAASKFLYGNDEDAGRIADGVLRSFIREYIGEEVDLYSFLEFSGQSPYAFLARQGSGGNIQWIFAVQTKMDSDSVLKTVDRLQEGFSQNFSQALVRTRIMPNGITVRDVVADSDGVLRKQHSYRNYAVREAFHKQSGERWIDAHHKGAYLLGNDELLLKEAIDSGFMSAIAVFRVTRAGFDRLSGVFPDSDMIRVISALIPEDGELCPGCLFCASEVVLP